MLDRAAQHHKPSRHPHLLGNALAIVQLASSLLLQGGDEEPVEVRGCEGLDVSGERGNPSCFLLEWTCLPYLDSFLELDDSLRHHVFSS